MNDNITIGMDLGDKSHVAVVLDAQGEEQMVGRVTNTTVGIRNFFDKIKLLCQHQYPETQLLQQIPGVGPVTALCYALTIEDPSRFSKSRQVGPFLGLTPRRDQSGKVDKQLPISKAGNSYLRKLLVAADIKDCGVKIAAPTNGY